MFAVGDFFKSPYRFIDVLDLTSESSCWKPFVDMLVKRSQLGVGVINNCLYAVCYVEI